MAPNGEKGVSSILDVNQLNNVTHNFRYFFANVMLSEILSTPYNRNVIVDFY